MGILGRFLCCFLSCTNYSCSMKEVQAPLRKRCYIFVFNMRRWSLSREWRCRTNICPRLSWKRPAWVWWAGRRIHMLAILLWGSRILKEQNHCVALELSVHGRYRIVHCKKSYGDWRNGSVRQVPACTWKTGMTVCVCLYLTSAGTVVI